jgi:hypothetical protein
MKNGIGVCGVGGPSIEEIGMNRSALRSKWISTPEL